MPTYRNNTSSRINVPEFGVIINPQNSYQTKEHLSDLHGLTLTSILPIWNPFIISGEFSGTPSSDIIISIPEIINSFPVINYVIDISSMSGAIKIYFTDKSNFGVPLILSAGCGYSTPVFRRKVTSIILEYTRSGKTRVNVSFLEEFQHVISLT